VVEGLQKVKDGMTVNAKLVSMESSTAAPSSAGQRAQSAATPSAQPAPISSGKPVAGHEQ
jgi:hypothetical protein